MRGDEWNMGTKGTRNIYKEQRIGIFVDVQNMYYSAKYLHKAKANFKAILDEAVKGR